FLSIFNQSEGILLPIPPPSPSSHDTFLDLVVESEIGCEAIFFIFTKDFSQILLSDVYVGKSLLLQEIRIGWIKLFKINFERTFDDSGRNFLLIDVIFKKLFHHLSNI